MKSGKILLKNAQRLGELTLRKEKLETEIKLVREFLEKSITEGESFDFEVIGFADLDDQLFTITNRLEDKAVLKDNPALVKILGRDNFVSIAKISKTEVEKTFGKAVAASCVEKYETTPKLVLRKVT